MAESYLIDGVGNEVTITLGIIIGILIVVVSWLSTRVNDTSFTTDEIRTTRQTVNNASQSGNSNQTSTTQPQNLSNESSPSILEQASETAGSTNDTLPSGIAQEQSGLRHRRNPTDETDSPSTSSAPSSSQFHSADSSIPSSPTASSNSSPVHIRLKYMDETTQTFEANPDETLQNFRIRSLPQENQNRYRLIYRGQVLQDGTKTLRQLNLVLKQDGESESIPVIHCFLSPVSNDTPGSSANSASQQLHMMTEELHIGSLMLPILGLCLACLWYLCIFHTSLFSIQSLVSIIGFTFLYITLIVNHFL